MSCGKTVLGRSNICERSGRSGSAALRARYFAAGMAPGRLQASEVRESSKARELSMPIWRWAEASISAREKTKPSSEELALNGVRREAVSDTYGGAHRTLCASAGS